MRIRRPLCMLCLAFVLLVALIQYRNPLPSFSLGEWEGKTISLQGVVTQKQFKDEELILTLSNVAFCNETNPNQVICYLKEQTNQIVQKNSLEPKMGSIVKVIGKAECFKSATNPGEFDRKRYYQLEGTIFQMKSCNITAVSKSYHPWKEGLYQIRSACARRLSALFPPKESGVLQAMLLAQKQEMDPQLKQLYQVNGIAHILAISGVHIAILGMGIYEILKRIYVPLPIAIIVSIFIIFQYATMIGMNSSAFRAVVMFAVKLGADLFCRTYDILTALALASVILLVSNPFYLYQTGFLLSFLAIIGIALLQPCIMGCILDRNESKGKLASLGTPLGKALLFFYQSFLTTRNALISSASVLLITLPVLLYTYFEIPLYSIILNLFILPLVGVIIGFGIVDLFIGSGVPLVSFLGVLLPCSVLRFYEVLCLVTYQLPYSRIVIGQPKWWKIIVYYLLLGIFLIIGQYVKQVRLRLCSLVLIPIAISILCITIPHSLQIRMLDIGQGDAIVVRSPSKMTYVMDAGSSSKKEIATYQIIPFLKSQGIYKIDYFFVSHMDIDHISGLIELLTAMSEQSFQAIPVKSIVLPAIGDPKDRSDIFQQIIDLAGQNNVEIRYIGGGDTMSDGDIRITCVFPAHNEMEDSNNEASMVLHLQYGEFDMLFTGDSEGIGEEATMQYVENHKISTIEILKVAHHGSKNSTSETFLEVVDPEFAMISCGKNNRYGHPHKETMERLETSKVKWLTTAEQGAIYVEVEKKGNRVSFSHYK